MIVEKKSLRGTIEKIAAETPIVDMHTHIYPPSFGPLLLWGIDELLTYHYLVAETMRVADVSIASFWKMPKTEQADLIWRELFLRRSPVSEACRGVLTVLQTLGIGGGERNLNKIRAYFREQKIEDYIETVFQKANVRYAVMTNDPFDKTEREFWLKTGAHHPRLRTALRVDPLLMGWDLTSNLLREQGYEAGPALNDADMAQVRRFLEDWADRMKPLYLAVSLTPAFSYPDGEEATCIIDSCIIPFARERRLPFALMIGVRRQINPALKLAGDGVGASDIVSLANLCANYPNNRFLATFLSRENQHEFCVTARKFPNLLPFGCWWFLNNPSLIEEMTRMRLELLGLSFIPQHSDARVLDQMIYKWAHSRKIIAKVLADKYEDLADAGWTIAEEEIRKDVKRLFSENFEAFVFAKGE
ncbi:MAG: glucuronate isomerase [Candidatus Omnitrophota bacterium]